MWRLDVSSEAELDIFEAALQYEHEREGLGFRFDSEVEAVFTRMTESPFQFPTIEHNVRRALLRGFPYGVYFTLKDDRMTVLAVLHLHRHPDTWKRHEDDRA
jgi:plasmid stabilization system protein ParE